MFHISLRSNDSIKPGMLHSLAPSGVARRARRQLQGSHGIDLRGQQSSVQCSAMRLGWHDMPCNARKAAEARPLQLRQSVE